MFGNKEPKFRKEHKALIPQIIQLLQDEGFTYFSSQSTVQLVMDAGQKTKDPVKSLDVAGKITQMIMDVPGTDRLQISAILVKLSEEINKSVNNMALSEIQIDENA